MLMWSNFITKIFTQNLSSATYTKGDWVFLCNKMNDFKKLIEEENRIMIILKEKHSEVYYEMFGRFILEGMDIRTAIWQCWNELECGGKNG